MKKDSHLDYYKVLEIFKNTDQNCLEAMTITSQQVVKRVVP